MVRGHKSEMFTASLLRLRPPSHRLCAIPLLTGRLFARAREWRTAMAQPLVFVSQSR